MNIVYLRTDVSPDEVKVGGSVAHTLGVIRALKKRGDSIYCASSAMKRILSSEGLDGFVPLSIAPILFFLFWRLWHIRWGLDLLLSGPLFALQTRKFFRNPIDLIYQRYSLLNCSGVLLKWWFKVPLVLEYNGSEVWAFEKWSSRDAHAPLFKFSWLSKKIEAYNLCFADTIVVVSEELRSELITRGVSPAKITCVSNGVDVDEYDSSRYVADRVKLRKELSLEDKIVVGFVGTFSYWHGIEVIKESIPEIVREHNNISFLLIGDGPLKKDLQDFVKQHGFESSVVCTGALLADDSRRYLAACDMYVSPTYDKNDDGSPFFGSPTKLFEYLSMGKPVIVSKIKHLCAVTAPIADESESIISNDTTGLCVTPNSIDSFSRAVVKIARLDDGVRQKIGENARRRALDWTWDKHVEKILRGRCEHNGK